jgi:hypothetical protein
MSKENYDPTDNVCQDQADFNEAVHRAVKYNRKREINDSKPWIYVYIVVWFIFLIWAIMLAMQIQNSTEKVEHLVFAMVFPPVYVLSHYLGMMSSNKSRYFPNTSGETSFQFGMRNRGCGMY